MPNSCVAFGCKSNYATCKQKVTAFRFPDESKNPELFQVWIRFVNRPESNWKPSSSSVLCMHHFEEKFLKVGEVRTHLRWEMNPFPTMHSSEVLKRPSLVPTPVVPRKVPKVRVYQEDQLEKFLESDVIKCFNDLNETRCPPGYQFSKRDDCVIFYKLIFDEATSFPAVFGSIKVDRDFHVQLQCNGNPLPLPVWFIQGTDAKLKRFSALENLPKEIENAASNTACHLLDELEKRRNFKPKGRPPYSADMVRYALLLRYTSLQAYKLLIEKFPLPSISLLNKLHANGVDSMKSVKKLLEKGEISKDVILMFDEMYLQKGAQFHSGDYVGADEDGNLYKGILVFMIVGLKKSVPYVIKAFPETKLEGKWISEEIDNAISSLAKAGFNVRGVVADNHSTNVNAFKILRKNHPAGSSEFSIKHPASTCNTYVFYDNVHLLKNIRNNLFNVKKFVFPEFSFKVKNKTVSSDAGYVSWSDLHKIYDQDSKLNGNLRKGPRLTYRALHPGNNKQCVKLALAIFDETTIAAVRSYLPNRKDMASFLDLILTWWTVINSSKRFTSNPISSGFEKNDGKTDFLRSFASWLDEWSKSPAFCLSAQTSKALILTLRAQAALIDELLSTDDYLYVIPRKLQSDPLENRFSQYRQMSGGRFLVSLLEVRNSERILACRSLLLEDVNFWAEDLAPDNENGVMDEFSKFIEVEDFDIYEACLTDESEEVACTIAGYIAKKLSDKTKCDDCKKKLVAPQYKISDNSYFNLLSRGGLTIANASLTEFVAYGFAVLDTVDSKIEKFPSITTRSAAEFVLKKYSQPARFTCERHENWGKHFSIKSIVNIFYNNKQKLAADSVRRDAVVDFKKRQREK